MKYFLLQFYLYATRQNIELNDQTNLTSQIQHDLALASKQVLGFTWPLSSKPMSSDNQIFEKHYQFMGRPIMTSQSKRVYV
jgi:hypothetical protein